MEFYRFSKSNVYVKKMDHSMDANPVLYLGVKIGKFGVLSFREFVTDSMKLSINYLLNWHDRTA